MSTVNPKPAYSGWQLFRLVLRPERRFYWLMLVYGLAISALTLSIPLSVQVLISTVVNAALLQPVLVLAAALLFLLLLSGLFLAIQYYLMELFERRFFSRIVSEVALRLIYAEPAYMARINRDELVNRYFDIMTVQKALPTLLTGALATLLQAMVGIAVTSFYHPVFVIYNGVVILCGYLVYRVFARGAKRSALEVSDAKYDAARWLEELARSNSFFKARRTVAYAIARTRDVRDAYVEQHRRHFRFTFSQIVGFLLLYAIASASLLGIGGWLVILGQLTIGQLVAAELIFSAIFYGLTRLGYYLELYYDLYAAMTKLLQLFQLEEETRRIDDGVDDWSAEIVFDQVHMPLQNGELFADIRLAPGSLTLFETRSSSQITALTDVLGRLQRPRSGRVLLGGFDIDDFDVQRLRDEVHVIDSTTFPECTIAEFLDIAAPGLTRARMRALLDTVGLAADLPTGGDGLDRRLTHSGYPLSPAGVIKLKIAFALAARPRVLVLTPLFDMLSHEARVSTIDYLRAQRNITVMCFSHRRDLDTFDRFVLCDFDGLRSHDSLDALHAALDDAQERTRRDAMTRDSAESPA